MLLSYNDLRHFAIKAANGRTGHVEDFYFDDETWRIRYLVTKSGFLFTTQQSLVKSTLMTTPDVETRTLPISLTREQLDEAKGPDSHPPVSKQKERRTVREWQFEQWPPLMLGMPGAVYTPTAAEQQLLGDPQAGRKRDEALKPPEDPHLRSMAEVLGYTLTARDGKIGSVVDFLVKPDSWMIRYVVADTGTWLPGRQVVIRPDWISAFSWSDRSITTVEDLETVRQAPEISQIDELERSDASLAFAPYGAYGGFPM